MTDIVNQMVLILETFQFVIIVLQEEDTLKIPVSDPG